MQRKKGFTLIEIVVAVSLFIIGLVGVFAVLPLALRSSKRTAISSQVGLCAKKVLTEIKLKERDWLRENCCRQCNCPLKGKDALLSWTITVEDISEEMSRIELVIKWKEDGKEKQEEFYTYKSSSF